MPSGTTVDWGNKPAVSTKVGEETKGTIKVTYPDGLSTIVPVTITGVTPSDNSTDADKYKPETQPVNIPVNGQLPAPSTVITNKDEMPTGTTYTWKQQPDIATPGDHTGVISINFPDGTTIDIPVSVHVMVTSSSEQLNEQAQSINSQVANGNGKVQSVNGQIAGTGMSNQIMNTVSTNNVPNATTANRSNAKNLPQTGNNDQAKSLTLMGLGLAMLAGLFGFGKKHHFEK